MNVVFFGTPDFVIPVVDALHEHCSLVGIVTTPDVIAGRKKILTPTPVKAHYKEINPDGIIIDSKLDNHAEDKLQALKPDVFVVAAYGHLVPESTLAIPKFGSLNVHPSLLPKYRGPSPIQTTLLKGDTISGITIIQMDNEIDHGPIVAQQKIAIKPTDTFASLHISMFQEAAKMLPDVLQQYVNGEITPQEQDHNHATFCDHITRQDGFFSIESPPSPEVLDRMIRAYYPWPTAWSVIKIKKQEMRIKFLPEKKIQLEGSKPTSIKDFLNGYPEMKSRLANLGVL
jgi:methionyl-tRNA formyltransferase